MIDFHKYVKSGKLKRIQCALQIFLIYYWMNFLRDTDAVYSVYLAFGIIGLITLL